MSLCGLSRSDLGSAGHLLHAAAEERPCGAGLTRLDGIKEGCRRGSSGYLYELLLMQA